jgi:hypothetical protein
VKILIVLFTSKNYTMERKQTSAQANVKTPPTPKKKRVHKRTLFMAVTPRKGALMALKQLPIFSKKKLAKKIAEKFNGEAVKVQLSW